MRSISLFTIVLAFVFTFQSCSKDDNGPDTNPGTPQYQYLLRSIHWDIGLKQEFEYNADRTIKQAYASMPGVAGAINYVWSAGQMKELSVDASLYTNHYSYNSKGLVSQVINSYKHDPAKSFYKLEYTYNANNTVNTLKYSTINEAGTELKATTVYEYKSNGDLYKTVTQQSAGSVITFVIDEYSAECEIYPWIYTGAALDEFYTLFNYPVMSKMKKFPAKISQLTKTGQGAAEIQRIDRNTLVIVNKRIDKRISETEHPNHPEYNRKNELLYNY